MDLYYKDELHLIEKGYKKLANSIHEIVKDPKKDLQHYPNITYDQPVIKTNTHFPPLPTKSMLSTIKVYTNNLTNSMQMPLNKYALLKNIGATKAKENEMVVTARNCNERINKKISTRTPTFPSLEKQNTITTTINNNNNNNNNNHNHDKNNTSNSKESNNTLITIVLPKTDTKFNYAKKKKHHFLKKHCQEKTLILKNIHRRIKYLCRNLKMENQQGN